MTNDEMAKEYGAYLARLGPAAGVVGVTGYDRAIRPEGIDWRAEVERLRAEKFEQATKEAETGRCHHCGKEL